MTSIQVHAFGLLDHKNAMAIHGRKFINCDQDGVCTIGRDPFEIRLTEHGRVSATEHRRALVTRALESARRRVDDSPWRQEFSRRGHDDCETWLPTLTGSSVTNPHTEAVTPDFVPYIERLLGPDDLLIIGNCQGAGLYRLRILPPAIASRTFVVYWDPPKLEPAYRQCGAADVCPRYLVFERIYAYLSAEYPDITAAVPEHQSGAPTIAVSPAN